MPKPTQVQLNQLNQVGEDAKNFENVINVVEEKIGEFIQRVHNNIEEEGLNVSGKINNIYSEPEGTVVHVWAPAHLEFVDKGVNGSVEKPYDTPYSYKDKMPPIQAFIDWIRARNIQTRNNEPHSRRRPDFENTANAEAAIRSAAYAMARNTFLYGQRPRNVYSREIPKLVEDIKETIKDFTKEHIKQTLLGK